MSNFARYAELVDSLRISRRLGNLVTENALEEEMENVWSSLSYKEKQATQEIAWRAYPELFDAKHMETVK